LISFSTSAAVVMGSPGGCSELGCPGSLAATNPVQDDGMEIGCS
jgi:hypothetical protein